MKPGELISFFVPGEPKPAGSKQAGVIYRKGPNGPVPVTTATGRVLTTVRDDSGEKGAQWRADVKRWGEIAMHGRPLLGGDKKTRIPIALVVLVVRDRPENHYGSRRGVTYVKASAPHRVASSPDILKLTRAIEDALTKVVYFDDSRIAQEYLDKVYTNKTYPKPGVWIVVSPRTGGLDLIQEMLDQTITEWLNDDHTGAAGGAEHEAGGVGAGGGLWHGPAPDAVRGVPGENGEA